MAARNGEVDVDSVSNLYSKAIRALTDFDVDLVVAMHPHFEKVGAVTEVTERFLFERIDVPKLPAAEDAAALAVILQRRIDRHGISAVVADVVTPEALAQLNAAYFLKDHNLRTVLNVADEAARLAVDAQASTIETSHVQPVLDRLPH